MLMHTNDIIELLPVVQDESIDLGIGRFFSDALVLYPGLSEYAGPEVITTYLLRLMQLVNSSVHTLL